MERFFGGAEDWRKTLTQLQPDAVLVDLAQPIYPKLLAEPGWKRVYVDSTQAVFFPVK